MIRMFKTKLRPGAIVMMMGIVGIGLGLGFSDTMIEKVLISLICGFIFIIGFFLESKLLQDWIERQITEDQNEWS